MNLPFHASTAIHGNGFYPPFEFCKLADFLASLHGKFSGRAENQSVNKGFCILWNLFNNGNAECGSFARTRVGFSDDVFAFEQQGNGFRLNFGHFGKILGGNRL